MNKSIIYRIAQERVWFEQWINRIAKERINFHIHFVEDVNKDDIIHLKIYLYFGRFWRPKEDFVEKPDWKIYIMLLDKSDMAAEEYLDVIGTINDVSRNTGLETENSMVLYLLFHLLVYDFERYQNN